MLDLFFGALLVGFGPAMVFLITVVLPHSHMAVLTVLAAFFQLVALLFTSLLHLADAPKQVYITVCLGVLLQEIARFALIRLYFRVERELLKKTGLQVMPWTTFASAVGSGFGFGLMNALVLFGSLLGQSTGRADYFPCRDSTLSVFLIEAMVALGMQIAHVAWMVLAFGNGKGRRRYGLLVFLLHMMTSLATLLNSQDEENSCKLGLPLQWVGVVVSVVLAGVL